MVTKRRSQRIAKATDNRSRLQVDRSKTIAPKGRGKSINIGKAVSKVAGKLDPRKKDFLTISASLGPAGRAAAKAIGARSKAKRRGPASRSRLRMGGR